MNITYAKTTMIQNKQAQLIGHSPAGAPFYRTDDGMIWLYSFQWGFVSQGNDESRLNIRRD